MATLSGNKVKHRSPALKGTWDGAGASAAIRFWVQVGAACSEAAEAQSRVLAPGGGRHGLWTKVPGETFQVKGDRGWILHWVSRQSDRQLRPLKALPVTPMGVGPLPASQS